MQYIIQKMDQDVLGEYKGHYYAKAVVRQSLTTEDLVEHMANHNSTYSEGTIVGVIKDMTKCVRELILDGCSVKIDNLGVFAASIVNNEGGLATLENFNISKLVKGVKMNCLGTGDLSKAKIGTDYKLQHVTSYDSDQLVESTTTNGSTSESGTGSGTSSSTGDSSNSGSDGGLDDNVGE